MRAAYNGFIETMATAPVLLIITLFWVLGFLVNVAFIVHHRRLIREGRAPKRICNGQGKMLARWLAAAYCSYGVYIYGAALFGFVDPIVMGGACFRPTIPVIVTLLTIDAVLDWIPNSLADAISHRAGLIDQIREVGNGDF